MPRRIRDGRAARVGASQSLAVAAKWQLLRAFLIVEALKDDKNALHLLREMRGKAGQVKA